MIIGEILARNARMYGDEIALIEREPEKNSRKVMTWEEFDVLANRVATALIEKGVNKGDKVIHLMMNCIEWLPLYFGILRTGAWAVPLNFRFSADEILYCADISEGKVLIFGEEFVERINTIRDDLGNVENFIFIGSEDMRPEYAERFEDFLETGSADNPNVPISLLDEAALYFTCIAENRHHNQTHEDNFLLIPPLYHTGAKMHWFGSFIVGGKAVILKGVKPNWILEAVSEEQATIVWLLVPWAQDILLAIERGDAKLEDYKLDQWRLMHIGAQPVPPSLIRNWKKVFPHHECDSNYGLSESTGPGPVHLGMENLHKVGAIGRPGFDWECKIVDESMNEVARGEPGELSIKGPGVMKEYYKNPETTRKTIIDGWLLTGDMARYDEDGFIWLVDRKKDVIITGGENIFPVEIEDFLQEHDKIRDAAAIGVPDERLGEITAAIIMLKPGREMTEEEVLEYCETLPRHKRPRIIYFDDVPRNPTGKIEKPKLRKKFGGIAEGFKL
jgi:acyl-CoA synthetase (AMP-forming)/AMP-acid ligase II